MLLIILLFLIIFFIIILSCTAYYVPEWYRQQMIPFYEPLKELPLANTNNIKKVCMFMIATPEISDYAKYSEEINRKYCEKFNIDFKIFDKNLTPDLPINFSKLQATLNLMKDNYDYIIHIDADAVVYNFDYDIRNIIAKYMIFPVAFIASEDCYNYEICSKPGKMNSGVYIVRNNAIGKGVINLWLDSARGKCKSFTTQFPNCQLVFDKCVKDPMFFAIRIIPYNVLNGKDGLLISHMMQATSRERIDEMRKVQDEQFAPERQRVYS